MVGYPCLHGHHCSRISLTLGSRAPSSNKSSRDGFHLPMDWYLMCLVPGSNLSLGVLLVRLKVFLQEFVLHQTYQLVTQSYTTLNVMPKSLVEFKTKPPFVAPDSCQAFEGTSTFPRLCFTLKSSYRIRGFAWLTKNCSLNNLENWSKEMMWPSRKPTKPLQGCVCECTHEHLAMDNIYSPENNHLGIERRKMVFRVFYSRENDLRCDVVWQHKHIHDFLQEWLGTSSRGHIQTSLPYRALIKLL